MTRFLETLRKYRQGSAESDGGFSILELMMALTVLAIGIVSVLGTLVVAAKTAGVQRYRLNAVQIANEQMELIRSRQYAYIGIDEAYVGDPGLPQMSTSTDTVTVTDSALAVNPFPPPIVRQGVTYNVAINIGWISYDDPATGQFYERAYKHTRVNVTWTDQVGTHTVSVESDIYPGNQGPQREFGLPDEATIPPPAPSGLFVATATGYTDTAVIDVKWVDNASGPANEAYFVLAVASLPSSPGTCNNPILDSFYLDIPHNQPQDATYYLHSGLAYNYFHCFRIKAVNAAGESAWAYSNVYQTGPAPDGTPCSLSNTVVLSPAEDSSSPPNRVKLRNNGNNERSIALKVTMNGQCNAATARADVPRHPSGSTTVTLGTASSDLVTVLPPDFQKFSTGQQAVVFRINSAIDGSEAQATQQVCWYKSNPTSCS